MEQYTHYCTVEQAERAYKLGAPLCTTNVVGGCHISQPDKYVVRDAEPHVFCIPTTQQMMEWLIEKLEITEWNFRNVCKNLQA